MNQVQKQSVDGVMPGEEILVERETHLRDYLRVIRKRKFTLLTIFIIVNVVTILNTFTATPLFTASARLLIEKNESTQLTNLGYISYDPEFLETQSQIIKSSSVGRKVVQLLDLEKADDSYISGTVNPFSPAVMLKKWMGELKNLAANIVSEGEAAPVEASEKEPLDREGQLALAVSGGISVSPVPESRIVSVSYTSPNAELATNIVNAVSKAYIEKILDMHMQSSGYTIEWMTDKAEEERVKLAKSEAALQKYMKDNDIVTIENRITITPQKLSELSRQLTQAEGERKALEAIYRQVETSEGKIDKLATLPAIAENTAIQSIRTEIGKADGKIAELSKKYGPKHPTMKRAVAELSDLNKKMKQEILHASRTIKNQYELTRENETSYRGLLNKTKKSAIDLNEKFIQYGILKRDVENNRKMYDALITRIKEKGVTEQVQTTNVWVVQEADVPEAPTSPRVRRNLMMGLLLGLMGGIGLCLFLEYLDNTVKSPDDARDRFGLPVLGLITRADSSKAPVERAVLEDSHSTMAEGYKTLRTQLMLSMGDRAPRSVLITSMSPEEGKTTTAINLAITVALADKRVLLIDGDLRRPQVHKIMEIENEKGLTTFLSGSSDDKIFHKWVIGNLTIIPAGPTAPNPSELLSSKRMQQLINLVQRKYDLVIFDSAPVMTVTDTLVLSRLVDGAALVVRADKTTYEMIGSGLRKLGEINAPVLGMVINDVLMKKSNYYYYNYYDYGYHKRKKKD